MLRRFLRSVLERSNPHRDDLRTRGITTITSGLKMRSYSYCDALTVGVLAGAVCCLPKARSYNPLSVRQITTCRRVWMQRSVLLVSTTFTSSALPVLAAATDDDDPRKDIAKAQSTLGKLLDNWERATVDCTFADVPRELLETKNKELLLEKASTYALFDKSVSVESCKTTNRIVRDYLGVTGKGPLVGMDRTLKLALDYINPDQLDDYVNEMEAFSQNMSRAAAVSFMASSDFDSVNNFQKEEFTPNKRSNLEEARRAIVDAKGSLDRIVIMMGDQ